MKGIMRDIYTPTESGNVQQTTAPVQQVPIQQGGFGQNVPTTSVGQPGVFNQPFTTLENMPKEVRELPAIVKETILPQQVTQVQPVIHRDREQVEFHKIVQPMQERDIAPTQVQHAMLPQEYRQPVRMPDTQFQQQYRAAPILPQTTYTAPQTTVVQKQPILEETFHKKIVEEVQPVLYKEVVRPTVIQQTRPIYETFVDSPQLFTEERPVRDLGTHVLPSQFQQPLTQPFTQQPFIQQPFIQQPFTQRTPSQVGLVGLPPRDVIPSTQLFGDTTGYGRPNLARDVGTGLSPPLAQQPLTQQPLAQQPLVQQPLTQQSLILQPLPQPLAQPTIVTPVNIPAEKGFRSLSEEILKVEYEVHNITEGATGEPYVERTVTKLQSNAPLTENLWGGSNIGKAATINQPQTI